jgi:putative ABC transport system ATP-binding protein
MGKECHVQATLFRFITLETRRQQVLLICLTLLSFPILYALLNVPKIIINDAIGGKNFPKHYFDFHIDQIHYLILLSVVFFALVVLNGVLKFFMNYQQGKTTEYSCFLLREHIFDEIMAFRLAYFKHYSTAELNHMMATEVEPIGAFAGESIALPFRQGGTLMTLLLFVFIQDFYMGLAAISLYPMQVYLVPIFQRKMNILTRKRSQALQMFGEKIQETSEGIVDIKSYGLQKHVTHLYDDEAKNLFNIKTNYFREKYYLKLLNNIIGNIVPFLFYAIGGYFVIKGNLSLGALVSILAAHKDLQEPWIELLDYYQRLDDSRIRYQNLRRKLSIPEEEQIPAQPFIQKDRMDILQTNFVAKNLYYAKGQGNPIIEAASFELRPSGKTAIVSSAGEGKGVFTQVLAGLHYPKAGELYLSNSEFLAEPQMLLGKEIHFVDHEAHIFGGTIKDNLLLPYIAEESGIEPEPEKMREIIGRLHLEEDFIYIGLTKMYPHIEKDVQSQIVQIRAHFKKEVSVQYGKGLVDFYEKDQFNSNLSLFENLTFGMPLASFSPEKIEIYVEKLLKQTGLFREFMNIGYNIAQTMFDIFSDLSPNHPFLEEFSLIKANELDDYKNILGQYPHIDSIEQRKLINLAHRFIPERHRILSIGEDIAHKIVLFREEFKVFFMEEHGDSFNFYDETRYNDFMSVWDNIVFGKMIYGLAAGQAKIDTIIQGILGDSPLKDYLFNLSLHFNVGLGGKNISRTQRQLIGIARALLSSAQLIVLDKATLGLDVENHRRVLDYILSKDFKKGVIWAVHESQMARDFDTILLFKDGRVLEQGSFKELMGVNGAFKELFEQEQRLGMSHVA